MRLSNTKNQNEKMTQLETSLLLSFVYFNTILQEIVFLSSSSSPKITIIEQIQFVFPSERSYSTVFYGLIICLLSMMLLLQTFTHGIFIVYVILFKFFQSLPLLFDLINLLLIYQYKNEHVVDHCTWHRFYLTFGLIAIRFLFSLNRIRQSKRPIIVIFDLLLFTLITISLFRDSTSSIMRLGRKITLGALIFHLNYLFSNENFWLDVAERNALREQRLHIKPSTKRCHTTLRTIILNIILKLRWIL